MTRSLGLLLVCASGIAAAAPPSPLWRASKACPHGYAGTPTLLVAVDGGKLRRIERVTGNGVAAIDVPTGKQRWQRAVAGAQAAAVGDALFIRHGAKVERVVAATGAATWAVDVPIGGFAIKASPAHVFVRDAAKIIALDPATG